MKTLNYFDLYMLDDSNWTNSIIDSVESYLLNGEDLDNNSTIDEYDYELYLDSCVKHLDHAHALA